MRLLIVIGVLLALPTAPRAAAAGCQSDMECKGDRICEGGRCVAPPAKARPEAPAARDPGKLNPHEDGSGVPGVRYEDDVPAAEKSSLTGGIALQWLLIRDKVGLGPRFLLRGDYFGIHLDFDLIYTTADDPSGVLDGSFVGSMLSVQPMGRIPVHRQVDLRAGMGLDFFFLWGVNWDEWQFGLPVVAEVDVNLLGNLVWFLQSRLYLIQTEGLEVGVDRAGEELAPILLVTGLGGEW